MLIHSSEPFITQGLNTHQIHFNKFKVRINGSLNQKK